MTVSLEEFRQQKIDADLCVKVEDELLAVLNRNKLSLRELVTVLGEVLVSVGGALEGVSAPPAEGWRAAYVDQPSLGYALALLGFDMLEDWVGEK